MPILRCATDATHTTFKGLQHVRCEFHADVAADGVGERRTFSVELEDLSSPLHHEIRCATCGSVVWPGWRGISFIPSAGQVLECDFSVGFQVPEIVSIRPVIVVSERDKNAQTVLVVPLSHQQPRDPNAISVPFAAADYSFLDGDSWAKCALVYAVRRGRLDRRRDPKTGIRMDSRQSTISDDDLRRVREGIKQAIGLA